MSLLMPYHYEDAPYDASGVDGWNYSDVNQICCGIDLTSNEDKAFAIDCIAEKLTAWQMRDAWRETLQARIDAANQQIDTDMVLLENEELREQVADLKREVSQLTIKILRGKGL